MKTAIKKISKLKNNENTIVLCYNKLNLSNIKLSKDEISYINKEIKAKRNFISLNQLNRLVFVAVVNEKDDTYKTKEEFRKQGSEVLSVMDRINLDDLTVIDNTNKKDFAIDFTEGLVLSNYKFDKYLTVKKDYKKVINLFSSKINKKDIHELAAICEATLIARDLVNEPLSYLTAPQLSKSIESLSKQAGFSSETLNKKKIEALKMGGLLAVNKGSVDPPTFNILEWKPSNAKNKKPIVFVGKGVVYDTGGLSLKPTAHSMDIMKSDMGGAASVVGALYAIAKAKLPIHVVGLIPATDNRPGGNAYAPGDIIEMMNGSTVEVLNTDAEGRMILADALCYAKKYKPELVIDLATLTGSAVRSVGTIATVSMGNADKEHLEIQKSGYNTYERLAPMPFWDEYGEMVKSKIADLNNVGGAYAGAITAGKFLEHFTLEKGKKAYPWLHLDIAGPAFLDSDDSYRTAGGTGVGVRLLFDFIKNK
jgi:leucyl aminopeptidase